MCFDHMPVEEPYWVPTGNGKWAIRVVGNSNHISQALQAPVNPVQPPRPRLYKRDGRWWCYTPGILGYASLSENSSVSEHMQRVLAYREWRACARRLGLV